ncbi:AAA family ATPase [Henriciella litoralis]|uniref:AAA family ATPase n=1 Tax=Henriciella litoralis TaxID=568102 RepID=UPI000A0411B8|nr:AAA family ATPase [Henriciella litoralis]
MIDRRRIVISGCSSGGKSTLLAALSDRGYATIEEPGRNIVREALASGSDALPWIDPVAFVRKAVDQARNSLREMAPFDGPVFLDRSAIDAIAHLERLSLPMPVDITDQAKHCIYSAPVFMAPPWRELYVQDDERPLPFEEATKEYNWLRLAYPRRGYVLIDLPRISVEARADFMLRTLGLPLDRRA